MPRAARMTDQCGTEDPVGAIILGAPTVLIGGMPAAREGDPALLGLSTDVVLSGEMSVYISGHEAARIGDPLVRGTRILTGYPTVLIGPDKILPCDVETLTVNVSYIAEKATKVIMAAVARPLRIEPPPDGVDEEIVELLGSYDVVIDVVASIPDEDAAKAETVAEPETTGKSGAGSNPGGKSEPRREGGQPAKPAQDAQEDAPKPVHIRATSTYYKSCTRRMHPRMRYTPITKVKEIPALVEKRAMELPERELYAPGMSFVEEHGQGLGVLFQFIRELFGSCSTKRVAVEAEGCGSRDPGDGAAIGKLGALVRVYRDDTWSLSISLPSYVSGSNERSWTRSFTGEEKGDVSETKKTSSSDFKRNKRESSTKEYSGPKGQSTTHATTTWEGKQGTSTSTTHGTDKNGVAYVDGQTQTKGEGKEEFAWRSDGSNPKNWEPVGDGFGATTSEEELKKKGEAMLRSGGVTISLKRNDQEVKLDILDLLEKIANGLYLLKKEFEDAIAALKRAPQIQIGWKFSASFQLLEGSINLEWKPVSVPCIGGRYWPVENQWKLAVKLLIVKLEVELSFGLDIKVWRLFEATVKVWGKLSGALEAELNLTWADKFESAKREVTLTIELEIGAKAYVSVFGYSIVDMSAIAKGGVEIKSSLAFTPQKGLSLDVTGKATQAKLKLHLSLPFGIKKKKDITLWDERPMFQPIHF